MLYWKVYHLIYKSPSHATLLIRSVLFALNSIVQLLKISFVPIQREFVNETFHFPIRAISVPFIGGNNPLISETQTTCSELKKFCYRNVTLLDFSKNTKIPKAIIKQILVLIISRRKLALKLDMLPKHFTSLFRSLEIIGRDSLYEITSFIYFGSSWL